jgi:hypothetical protein
LQRLTDVGWLLDEGSSSPARKQVLAIGADCDGWTPLALVHAVEDTEVYLARGAAGRFGAIKIATKEEGPPMDSSFKREAKIYTHLNRCGTSELLHHGKMAALPALVVRWIEGIPISSAADELRAQGRWIELLWLVARMVESFARLHDQGVLHGDIQPKNVLVDANDKPYPIDFGLSFHAGLDQRPPRGGMAFFEEPEFAAARLERRQSPLTAAGEQYAIGALCHFLICGRHYLNFRLEREVMRRQVVDQSPLRLTECGTPDWPKVQVALGRALSKHPSERFETVNAFHVALCRAIEEAPDSAASASVPSRLIHNNWESFRIDSMRGLLRSPFSSTAYGAAGIAYTLLRVAHALEKPEPLFLADQWLCFAEHQLAESSACYEPTWGLTHETVGDTSVWFGKPGVFLVRALIAHAMADVPSLEDGCTSFLAACESIDTRSEMYSGSAGLLVGCAVLRDLGVQAEQVTRVGQQLCDRLLAQLAADGSMESTTGLDRLGFAHGWSGLIYAVMRWLRGSVANTTLNDALSLRCDELAICAEPFGRGRRWPMHRSAHVKEFMPGFCNGSAGHAMTFFESYSTTGNQQWLDVAIRAAWQTYEDADDDLTLCCGLVGRALTLLKCFQITNDAKWLQRAHLLRDRCDLGNWPSQFPSYSLLKGRLAMCLLDAELHQPDYARHPLLGG